jgi:hypothetical protein
VIEAARALVTGQMVADIVIVGLGVRIIVDAVKRGQRRQPIQAGSSAPTRCRWDTCGQRYVAVTVAVGAVTGRVLTV